MIVQISRKGPVTFESKILVKLEILFFLKLLGWKISSSFQKGTDILTSLLVLVCSCLSIKLYVTIKI